jgi:DNA-binding winged helix-turn-helix (wHTH) protein
MTDPGSESYAFGPFRVNAAEGVLLRDGAPIALPPKAFATLLALVRRPGRVVSRETLVHEVWPDTFVEDGNLTQNISILRKVLGTDDSGRPYLDTVPKRGYRFAPVVARVHEAVAGGGIQTAVDATAVAPLQNATPRARLLRRNTWGALVLAIVVVAIVLPVSWRRSSSTEAPPRAPVRSLAVLPFRSMLPVADDEYLALGIADTLIAQLSAISGLVVRPISAVTRLKNVGDDAAAFARQLSVDAVLCENSTDAATPPRGSRT